MIEAAATEVLALIALLLSRARFTPVIGRNEAVKILLRKAGK